MDNDVKARIDAGGKVLWQLITQAERGAAEACENGDMELSAGLHDLAAQLRIAYAVGRRLKQDGEFVAYGGGK